MIGRLETDLNLFFNDEYQLSRSDKLYFRLFKVFFRFKEVINSSNANSI